MNNKPTYIRWRIFGFLFLASFVSYVLRMNVNFVAPVMMEDLALSEIQWGWVAAAFTTGYAIFQFPGGLMGDRIGPRKALTLIMVLWGVFAILTSLVPGPDIASIGLVIGSLMLVRFLVGAVHAPIYPTMNASVMRWFPESGRALPLGLSSTGLGLGAAAAAPVVAWLAIQFGWRWAFVVLAPLGFIVAVLWWWYSRDDPADHPGPNEAELQLIGFKPQAAEEEEGGTPAWIRVLKNRNVLLLTVSYSCINFVFYMFFTWIPYYMVEIRGFGLQEAGFLTSGQWIAGAIGAALGGWICDKMCSRLGLRWGIRWPIIAGMVMCAILLIGGAVHPSPYIAVALLALCFFFHQMTEAAYWAASIAVGGLHAGAAGGVMNTGANSMGIVNSLLVPLLSTIFGWTVAIASGAVMALIAAGLMLFVRADQKLD
jgi:ACS family glucarate transporter-like MFS transporter